MITPKDYTLLINQIENNTYIARLKQYDPDAWQDCYACYSGNLRLDILKSLHKRALADGSIDDIAQEVWEIAFGQIAKFTWQGDGSLYRWLRVIALRRVQKRYARHTIQRQHLIDWDSTPNSSTLNWLFSRSTFLQRHTEAQVEANQELGAITQEIGRLKNPQHREIIQRWLFWEETPQSLAAEYDLKPQSISMVVWRFLRHWRTNQR